MEGSFTEFLNAYSALIQAVATVVLVALTTYYVGQARKSASELERTRKSEVMPMLAVRVEGRDPHTLDVYLTNVGRGAALYPRVSAPFVQEKLAGENIPPGGENVLVTLERVGTPEILELPEDKRVLSIKYKDIFGNNIISEALLMSEKTDGGESSKEGLTIYDWKVIFPED